MVVLHPKYDLNTRVAAACLALICQGQAQAQQIETDLTIAVAVPLTGAYRLFGEQFVAGISASPIGQFAKITTIDTQCSSEGGADSAITIATLPEPTIIVGYPCTDALDAAQATGLFANQNILVPYLSATGQAPTVNTENFGRTIHLAPALFGEANALADFVAEQWKQDAIALIDDGTLEGRSFADQILGELANRQITPVYITNFRPQLDNQVALVRLLQRSAATKLIIGGDRYDASVIAEAMQIVGYPMQIAGGSALKPGSADGILPDGTLIAQLPDFAQSPSAQEAVGVLTERGTNPEGFTLWGYAAGQLLTQWNASTGTIEPPIDKRAYQTALGDLVFESNNLITNLYRVQTVIAPQIPEGESQ